MSVKVLENQTILHCKNCGGSFFEENGINRITEKEAEQLSRDQENNEISGDNKLCLKDKSVMKPLANQENIPNDVTLLQCPVCKSIFAYADDLIKFKHAQDAKINYFKTWNIPLPSVKAVVVLSFVALISALTVSRFVFFNQGLSSTQAQDMIKNINFARSNRYLFVNFKTQLPATAQIIFTDKTADKQVTKAISTVPKTLHFITTGDIPASDEIWYQIIVKVDNKEIKTEMKKLEIK